MGARHVIVNLTLDIGEVAFDYLAPAQALTGQSIMVSHGWSMQ